MSKKEEDAFLKSIQGTSPLIKKNTFLKKIPDKILKTNPLKKEKKIKIENQLVKIKKNKENYFRAEKTHLNRKLKKGKIPIDKKIDFHGMSLFEAEQVFYSGLKNCFNNNMRCILFVTGKGVLKKNNENSEKTKLYYGKIRNNFMSWVEKKEASRLILSVEVAPIEQGADGAFLVYLRKKTKF